jgi:hypothetical protein
MLGRRVFMTKAFARWARGILSEAALCQAAREIELGRFEADLGGGLCKKRIARPGAGKSGGTRTLVATAFGAATINQIDKMASAGALKEICHDHGT